MIKILLDKFRTRWDFLIYVYNNNILSSFLYILGIFLTIIGFLLTPFILSMGFFVSLAGAALAIIGLFRDGHNLKKYKRYKLITKYGFSLDNIDMCESDILNDRNDRDKIGEYTRRKITLNEYENVSEYIFMSDDLNNYLWELSHQLILEPNYVKNSKITEIIKKNWDSLSHYLIHNAAIAFNNDKAFFNEKKLCMGDGFRLVDDEATLIVDCTKGSYYDSYLTNNIFEKFLQSTHGDMDIKDASSAFREMKPYFNRHDSTKTALEEANTLRSFKDLFLNNVFGVSTIAITKDHYVFQMIQSDRAMVSGCLIAPSGSGSCDYEDIYERNFRKTITYAMQRELWEEAGFKCPKREKRQRVEAFGKTYLVGFFRWLKRNGKPEFLGITYINFKYKHIRPNTAELKRKAVLEERIHTVDDFKAYLTKIKDEIRPQSTSDHNGVSVPLLACVAALEALLKDEGISKEIAEKLHLRIR